METQKLHRGRLIDHLQFVVKDLAKTRKFYDAVASALEIEIGGDGPGFFWIDELFVSSADSPAAQGKLTGRTHLAFQASDRAMVEKFHKKAIEAGGTDNGKPGERPYHPGYFAAFVIDPDGNNIEVVFHGPANRSSKSIEITFDS